MGIVSKWVKKDVALADRQSTSARYSGGRDLHPGPPLGTAWNIESMTCMLQGRCIWKFDWVLCFFNDAASSQQRLPATFTEDVQVLHVVHYDTPMTFTGKCAAVDFLAWMGHLKGLLNLVHWSAPNGRQVSPSLCTPAVVSATAPLGWPHSTNSKFSISLLMAHVNNSAINWDLKRSWAF